MAISVSAPAQARFTATSKAEPACWNTYSGRADWGPFSGFVRRASNPKAVASPTSPGRNGKGTGSA